MQISYGFITLKGIASNSEVAGLRTKVENFATAFEMLGFELDLGELVDHLPWNWSQCSEEFRWQTSVLRIWSLKVDASEE